MITKSTPYKRFFSVCTTDEDFVIVSLDIPLSSPFDYSSDYEKIIDSIQILESEPVISSSPDVSASYLHRQMIPLKQRIPR